MLLSEGERERRQLAAEILAIAVLELFPTVKLLGGQPTRLGFGYHFVFEQPLLPDALRLLEEKMGTVVREGRSIQSREMVRENAAELLNHREQSLRAERILGLPAGVLSVIQCGEFWDVVPGPFPPDTGSLGAFRLTVIESEPDGGTFIGGLVFATTKELRQHLRIQGAAKRCDHRRLGVELGLFAPAGRAGARLWYWTAAGEIVRRELLGWWREQVVAMGSQEVTTPAVYRKEFLDEMGRIGSVEVGGSDAVCEDVSFGHALLFAQTVHSYKNLPLSFAECSVRLSGSGTEEMGLQRALEQVRDVTTCFCLEDHLASTLASALHFIQQALSMLGFTHRVHLLGHRAGVRGTRREWVDGEQALARVAESQGLQPLLTPAPGGVTGPTMWVNPVDSLGREFTGPFIRIEPCLPGQLDLRVQGADGRVHVPQMVSASVFGSLERQVALLVEHFGGDLPVWLMPEQVRVLPVATDHQVLAEGLRDALRAEGVRVGIDARNERLGGRVRQAQLAKVPYTVVIGDREHDEGKLAVRNVIDGEVRRVANDEWIVQLKREIQTKALGGRTTRL